MRSVDGFTSVSCAISFGLDLVSRSACCVGGGGVAIAGADASCASMAVRRLANLAASSLPSSLAVVTDAVLEVDSVLRSMLAPEETLALRASAVGSERDAAPPGCVRDMEADLVWRMYAYTGDLFDETADWSSF